MSRSPAALVPKRATLLLHLVASALAFASCATNPATGGLQLSLISEEREIEMGREADRDVVRTMGIYPDSALGAYVADLGGELAATSERPELPWTFRVVDEPVINAFALPGGFIYMTRGILAHFGSEAQLAAVLGHEIGHVTARHSVNRMSRARLANIGLGIGTILSPEVARFQDLIGTGLQLAFLKFSRDDERQADDLGLRYMVRTGYEPREMPDVFRMLGRVSGAGDGERVPEWLSTHPNPENREERIAERIRELEASADTLSPGGLTVDREGYLRRLDGLVFGDDPRNGYFRGNTFLHPDLRFRFDFPTGWRTVNQARAVMGRSPDEDALLVVTLAEEESAMTALQAFLDRQGVEAGPTRREDIDGHPAEWLVFEARTGQGTLGGTVAFVEYGDRVYRLMGYTPAELYRRYAGTFEASIGSFGRLDDPEALAVEPARIEVVELPEAMTVEEFHRRWPSSIPLERIRLINQVEEGERLGAGRLMKRVVGEGAPGGG